MSHPLFEKHRATIERALQAIAERSYWSPYPESASPKVYGEGAAEAGKAAFDALLGKPFPLIQPGTVGAVGGERSPYGIELGVTYPRRISTRCSPASPRPHPAGVRRGRRPGSASASRRWRGSTRRASRSPTR